MINNIGIINTGNCNYKSVIYACKHVGLNARIIDSYTNEKFSGIIVPGVGNFGYAMRKLKSKNLDKLIIENIKNNLPSLFICLGMQILFETSEEDKNINGLSILKGKVFRINNDKKKIICPVVGWNKVMLIKEHKFFPSFKNENFYYFVHSYHVVPKNNDIIHSKVNYNGIEYCSSVNRGNLLGVQFHPEKSYKVGLDIYKDFKKIIDNENTI